MQTSDIFYPPMIAWHYDESYNKLTIEGAVIRIAEAVGKGLYVVKNIVKLEYSFGFLLLWVIFLIRMFDEVSVVIVKSDLVYSEIS